MVQSLIANERNDLQKHSVLQVGRLSLHSQMQQVRWVVHPSLTHLLCGVQDLGPTVQSVQSLPVPLCFPCSPADHCIEKRRSYLSVLKCPKQSPAQSKCPQSPLQVEKILSPLIQGMCVVCEVYTQEFSGLHHLDFQTPNVHWCSLGCPCPILFLVGQAWTYGPRLWCSVEVICVENNNKKHSEITFYRQFNTIAQPNISISALSYFLLHHPQLMV